MRVQSSTSSPLKSKSMDNKLATPPFCSHAVQLVKLARFPMTSRVGMDQWMPAINPGSRDTCFGGSDGHE